MDDLPIPAELALPPDDDLPARVAFTIDSALDLCDEAGLDPEAAAIMLIESSAPVAVDAGGRSVTRWHVTDETTAEWAMRKAAEAQAEIDEARERSALWQDRIRQWADKRTRKARATVAFFEYHLRDYGLRRRAETGGKVKSVPLPSGTIQTRSSTAPRVVVSDEPALLAWAKENLPDDVRATVVKTTEKVLVSELREHVEIVMHADGDRAVLWQGVPVVGVIIEDPAPTADVKLA